MRSQTDVLFARNCGGWIPCSYYDAKDEPVAKQGDDHDQAVDAHHQVVPRCEVILQWLYNFKLHDMWYIFTFIVFKSLRSVDLEDKIHHF